MAKLGVTMGELPLARGVCVLWRVVCLGGGEAREKCCSVGMSFCFNRWRIKYEFRSMASAWALLTDIAGISGTVFIVGLPYS